MIKIPIIICEFIKYFLVGFLNAIFTAIIFFVTLRYLKIEYHLAFFITWILGILLTYVLNFLWVFKPEAKLRYQERFVKYFIAHFMSFVLNLALLHIITEYGSCDPFYVQIVLIPFIVIINFLLSKYWALNRLQ